MEMLAGLYCCPPEFMPEKEIGHRRRKGGHGEEALIVG